MICLFKSKKMKELKNKLAKEFAKNHATPVKFSNKKAEILHKTAVESLRKKWIESSIEISFSEWLYFEFLGRLTD